MTDPGTADRTTARGQPGAPVRRNAACPCGSGHRHKSCCGAPREAGPASTRAARMLGALALQRSGRLAEAAAAYRGVLALAPDLPDAVHMLGVTLLLAGERRGALAQLRRSAELFGWSLTAAHHNLALAIAAALAHADRARTLALWEEYDRWRDDRAACSAPVSPGVGIVVTAAGDGRGLASALASVFAQTYRDVEVVVVADGDAAATVEARALARRGPFPLQWLPAAGDDRAAAIDAGVRRLRAPYVNVLEAHDRFAPTRVAAMVDAVARRGLDWGFSRALPLGADGTPVAPESSAPAARVAECADGVIACDTVGTAFLSSNPAPSRGMLFFSRSLFDRLGGFAGVGGSCRDFCLRAALLSEPAFVPTPEYEYRVDAACDRGGDEESDDALARFCTTVQDVACCDNRFAPTPGVWGARFFELALARRGVAPLPPPVLRAFADYALARLGAVGPGQARGPRDANDEARGVENPA